KFITGLATDYLSLPVSIQLKAPNAEVEVGTGASITSTGSTSIVSEADADASGEAIYHLDNGIKGVGFSFGFQRASPQAITTIDSNAMIAAGGLVNVESTVTSNASGVSRVTQNAGPGLLNNKTVAPFSARYGLKTDSDAQDKTGNGRGPQNTNPNA